MNGKRPMTRGTSNDVAMKLYRVGKMYRKGDSVQHRQSFKESLSGKLRFWSRPENVPKKVHDDSRFWALRDFSLEIKKGEILGVMGANGSGKSTLLKILSRVTKPSEGRVEIFGQVGSLLEVGTGFHPELTGRENIFLNGTILGMKKREIEARFDDIVAFSGVQEFLDTPVKRYSSGMQVRLAFSVAAHLEAEILLLDEVLAVGDADFQKKSLKKMESVATDGRTVILVSHNTQAVKSLCGSTVLLEKGRIVYAGETGQAIERYEKSSEKEEEAKPVFLHGVEILDLRIPGLEEAKAPLSYNTPLTAAMEIHTKIHLPTTYLTLIIEDTTGRYLIHHRSDFEGLSPVFEPGAYHVEVSLPEISLSSGSYRIWTQLHALLNGTWKHVISHKIPLHVRGRIETMGCLEVRGNWTWDKMNTQNAAHKS